MKQEYQDWIDNWLSEHKICAGLCFSATSLMLQSFPELIHVRGYVYDINNRKHSHWYLKTIDDEIIDPTAGQFVIIGDASFLRYEEYFESIDGKLPTGKCIDCGNMIYNDKLFCNDKCEESTIKYLNTNRMDI